MGLSPETAAREAARYLDLDPGFFLEQAAMAGMVVCTDGKMLHCGLIDDRADDPDRIEFLWMLLKKSGAGRAVRELLIKRGMVATVVAA